MQLAVARRDGGGDKFPLRINTKADEQPVNPRNMVGDDEDGSVDISSLLIVRPKSEPHAQHKAHEFQKQSRCPDVHQRGHVSANGPEVRIDKINKGWR